MILFQLTKIFVHLFEKENLNHQFAEMADQYMIQAASKE